MKTDAEILERTDYLMYRLLRRWLWRMAHGLRPSARTSAADVAALIADYKERHGDITAQGGRAG
jgi:hypothetical protein